MLKNLWGAKIAITIVLLLTGSFSFSKPLPVNSGAKAAIHFHHSTFSTFLKDTAFFRQHAFDSTGLCICLEQEYNEASYANAPKVTLNASVESFVEDYISKNRYMLEKISRNGQYYFKIIEQIFEKRGLPVELKYLAVIESKLRPSSLSSVGAAGLWQFMPATAKGLGLKIAGKIDERKNSYKSTLAAAKYLERLYSIYQDWLLVIAAYNCGPGGVNKAIKKAGSTSFWDLQYFLPQETRLHVKKFIGTHYFYEGHGSLTTLTREETEDHLESVASYIATQATLNTAVADLSKDANKKEPKPVHEIKITAVVHDEDLLKFIEKK
ncbi:MAG: transglycosylase SLT domain-containing protein [Terrimonas sp.]|nr:transglycosylase SLT domain-containing protein [Terrimonas sp.]